MKKILLIRLLLIFSIAIIALGLSTPGVCAEKDQPVSELSLKRADVLISLAQADLQEMTLTLNAAKQAVSLTQNNIDGLADALHNNAVGTAAVTVNSPAMNLQMQDNLRLQNNLLKLQQQRVTLLQQTQNLAQQNLQAVQNWKAQLQAKFLSQKQQQRQNALDQFAADMQQQQDQWLTHLQALNKQMQAAGGPGQYLTNPDYMHLEMQVFEAEEKSNINQIQLDLTRSHNHLERLTLVPGQTISLTTLNDMQDQTTQLIKELVDVKHMLESKIEVLQARIKVNAESMDSGMLALNVGQANLQMINGLLMGYQDQLKSTSDLLKNAISYKENITRQLNQQLSSRQGLPGFDRQAWLMLGKRLLQVPLLTWQGVSNLAKILVDAVITAQVWQWVVGIIAALIWAVVWKQARRNLTSAIAVLSQRSERFFTNQVLLVFLRIMRSHLTFLMLFAALLGLLVLLQMSMLTFSLVISLALVFIVFSLVIGIAKNLLVEGLADGNEYDVKFYFRLKWALIVGGVLTAMTVLVHQLPVAYDVQDLFRRLFMLFLLGIAVVLLRAWFVLPELLGKTLEASRPYVKQMVRWLGLIIPLSLLINALIGLVGYVELAWSIAAYQGIFLIVLTGFLFAGGLLSELIRVASEYLVRASKNGWLWTQAILKPIHLILKLVLIWTALAVLFAWYGWGPHSWAVTHLDAFLTLHLFTLAGSVITPVSFIELWLTIVVLVWVARWTREFTYRWMFAGVKDVSLRNSLGMFSQYTMVAIVILFGLQLVGINLTALTVIASTFALGIALGLRDLANNFVSGILLLMERPLRVGDYVTVGAYEGEVIHIGMRAVMIMTDDHQELLVPNANVFSQSFINWTYRDSVVRSIIPLKITRTDDPHRVQKIIIEVIKTIPEILTKPAVVVYLKRLDEVLLEFQVEYYVDMKKIYSRNSIKSKVLLAMWDRFKAEGINAPDSPHEVVLLTPNHREGEGDQ